MSKPLAFERMRHEETKAEVSRLQDALECSEALVSCVIEDLGVATITPGLVRMKRLEFLLQEALPVVQDPGYDNHQALEQCRDLADRIKVALDK